MENKFGTNPKIATTAVIWVFATGMLALCIPLVAISGSGAILPLAIILGASGGTVAVWSSSSQEYKKISELNNTVKQLKERVETLEAICSSNEFDIQKKFKELESRD